MIKVESALSQYLDYLRIERAMSPHTVSAYRRDVSAFIRECGEDVLSVKQPEIEKYLHNLRSQGLKESSVNRNLASLKSFFSYLEREFGLDNPCLGIATQKIPRRLPKALSVADVLALIENSWSESDPMTLRDRALIELLYGTGARVSEVVGLNLGDIEKVENEGLALSTIKVRGKGSKERVVPLGSFAQSALDDYLVRVRPSLSASKSGSALFLNHKGGRLSRVSAWNIVTEAAKRAGLTSLVSPHVFRHSYATHLLDGGADIRVVQELLGHASVTTTQIYTLITLDKVRESYITAHPRSR